jgi:hypothetical protein
MLGRKTGSVLVSAALVSGCAPELGDAPFACDVSGACPEGYSCQATVCVRDGAAPAARRPKRVVWINAAEMFWFPSPDGGASLLVNDGFTQGAHGIYELAVGADGKVGEPRTLLPYGDGPPISSATVALPDGRYGVATLRFPDVEGDQLRLELAAIKRQVEPGAPPSIENLYKAETPFLGGIEPAYIGAVLSGSAVDIAWTRPEGGGKVEVLHVERSGSVWQGTPMASAPLPANILPLSGDCALFRDDSGWLTVRVGFEEFALASVPASGGMMTFGAAPADMPLFAWKDSVYSMRYGDFDDASASYSLSFVLSDPAGATIDEDTDFVLQESLTPYAAVPFEGGALVAPLSRNADFAVLEVGLRSPTEPLRIVARVARESTETLYSARAFSDGKKVYLAWTEFHEASMDLWVAVTDLQRGGVMPLMAQPKRARTWPIVDGEQLEMMRARGGRKR